MALVASLQRMLMIVRAFPIQGLPSRPEDPQSYSRSQFGLRPLIIHLFLSSVFQWPRLTGER